LFGGTFGLQLQDHRLGQATNKHEAGSKACYSVQADLLLGLLFYPEDGGSMMLWNVS
jgi:hypothetical protein